MQVLQLGTVDDRRQVEAACQCIRQTVARRHAEQRVQIATAHVAIDQQHALAGLGDDRGEVAGDERLAHRGRRAGDHQHLVACLEHGELEAGAQAAQRFDGEVGRLADAEQAGLAIACLAPPVQLFLRGAVGQAGVHRYAELLDHVRALHATVERLAQQDHCRRDQQADEEGERHHQRANRLGRLLDHRVGVVDDTYVTDGSGAENVLLLRLVHQQRIGLGRDFHVTFEAQQLLLRHGQGVDLLQQLRLLRLQLVHLGHQRAIGRVLAGVEAVVLHALERQFRQLGLQLHDLVQHTLGLDADVHRLGTGLIVVQRGFGLFQLLAHLGQLRAQEVQSLGCLGGAALDVLVDVQAADLVQHPAGQLRVRIFQ